MTLLLSIVFIYSFTGILVYFFNKRFEQLVPFSFICYVLVFLLFGLLKKLSIGYYFLWVCILAFYIWIFIKKKSLNTFKGNFFTLGSLIFLLFMLFVYFLQVSRGFNYWDEIGHWGPMVKESLRLDKLYSVSESTLQRHKDYPPFFTLLQILWCYFNGSYKENLLYIANTTFVVSLFMPILPFKEFKRKNILFSFGFIICCLFALITIGNTSTASDSAHLFNSIYIDWPMAAFLAFTFYIIFDNNYNYFFYSLCFISLLLMKQMGLPFFLLALLLLIIKKFILDKTKINFQFCVFCLAIPLLFYFGWQLYIDHLGLADYAQFKISNISIKDLYSIIKSNDYSNWQVVTYHNFLNAIINRNLIVHPLKLSYFVYSIIVSVCLFLLSKNHKEGITLSSIYLFGSLAYCFAMMLLYIFCFGSTEGPQLASFDRYMITYLFFGNILLLMIFFRNHQLSSKNFLFCLIAICLLIEPGDLNDLNPFTNRKSLFGDNPIASITGYDVLNNDKVLVIEQNTDNAYVYAEFGYLESDNIHTQKFGISEWDNDNCLNLTLDEFKNYISSYDYVYIVSLNDYFVDYYCNNDLPFNQIGLYKLDNVNFSKVK